MNSIHISQSPIWLKPTDDIVCLADKTLIIVYPDESEQPVHIHVIRGAPNTQNDGKCAVKVWQSFTTDMTFTRVDSGVAPKTGQIHVWESFLDETAIKKIKNDDSGDYYGYDLLLKLDD